MQRCCFFSYLILFVYYFIPTFLTSHVLASNVRMQFVSSWPAPVIYFITSVAWMVPITPTTVPSTPAVDAEGISAAEGSGPKMSR